MFVLRCACLTALILLAHGALPHSFANAQARADVVSETSNAGSDQDSSDRDKVDQNESTTTKEAAANMSPGVLPTLAAVVPGLILHGAGHYVAGDKETASNLFFWQGIGLGLGVVSAVFLRYSGGSRYANEVTIPMAVSGAGLLINTFVADLFGSAGGGNDYLYQAPATQAAAFGYAYIYDPQFSYRHFSRVSGRLELGSFELAPHLWTALDDNNQRARAPLRYRILASERGEYLDVVSAFTYHNFGSEEFSTFVGELSLGARVEMQRLGHSLRGSFTTMSVGAGMQTTNYHVDGVGNDSLGLLLGHFGYGFYLPKSGELEGYYEHRRDTFSGGTSPSSRNGSGFLGHFGLKLRQPISEHFTLAANAEIGSAYLFSGGLEVQWGQRK